MDGVRVVESCALGFVGCDAVGWVKKLLEIFKRHWNLQPFLTLHNHVLSFMLNLVDGEGFIVVDVQFPIILSCNQWGTSSQNNILGIGVIVQGWES